MKAASSRQRATTNKPLPLVQAATAEEVLQTYPARDEARSLLTDGLPPLQFLDRLVNEEEQYPDAVDFIAHALPKREAVWWGCLCLWHTSSASLSGPERQALRAAVVWVLNPTDAHRQAAEGPAAKVPARPAGMIAAAVVRSGGSLLPADQPRVEPTPGMTGDAVAAGLHLVASAGEVVELYRRFVALGIGVARGKHTWIVPKTAARADQPFWPGQAF